MSAQWLKILAQKQDFGFETGPTIPFLLGAMRQPIGDPSSPEAGRRELGELVAQFQVHAKLQWCHGIEEFAVVARGPQTPFTISDPTGALKGIDPEDVSAMTDALWTRYQEFITTGRFSRDRDKKEWRVYRDHERNRIGTALATSN